MRSTPFWPTRKDSNLRPSESESDALSSCATGRYFVYLGIIPQSREKCNPFLKKIRLPLRLFVRPKPTENPPQVLLCTLWKTPPPPVDFSTTVPKSFPQPVENSVDISAKFRNIPCKIRLFGDFCRVKSNFWGVDNRRTVLFLLGLFHRGRERHKRYFGGFCGGKVNEKGSGYIRYH